MPTQALCGTEQRPTLIQEFCSRAQVRFSAFFHGHSVLTKERYGVAHIKTKAMNSHRPHIGMTGDDLRRDGQVSRSRTSTRSLIDPISSPLRSPGSPQTEELWQYRGAFFRPVSILSPDPRVETQVDHRSRGSFSTCNEGPSLVKKSKKERRCLPTIMDSQIKYKIVGSLISGTLLVLLLTICMLPAVSLEVSADTLSRSGAGSLWLDFRPVDSHCHDRPYLICHHGILPFLDSTVHAESSPSRPHKTSYQESS